MNLQARTTVFEYRSVFSGALVLERSGGGLP